MGKYVKTFEEFIIEAAEWDDTAKRFIDKYFVSFDEDEKYELKTILKKVIKKISDKDVTEEDVLKTMLECKKNIPHNNPRSALIKCVLKKYDIEMTE